MKWTACFSASTLALAIAMSPAQAAPKGAVIERSPDVLRGLKRPTIRPATPLVLAPSISAAAAPTVEEVGDPDSFGRNVTYLGLAQTQAVLVTTDCTGSDPTLERCIVANPAPAPTMFNESDLATISLPGKATKSLLCFTLTPFVNVSWFNSLATPANARFSANAVITIENAVLDDPTLLDPTTGLPYGGSITVGLSTFSDSHTLQPGENDTKSLFMSRSCIAGIVNKRGLVENYGLSETQAKEFFKKPITLRFGARGTVALADYANYFYGFRLYGD
jgi:hypothetical protein